MSTNATPTDDELHVEEADRVDAAALAALEASFFEEHPDLVDLRRAERAAVANAVAVFSLLFLSALLLAGGLATRSLGPWVAGALAAVVAFVVDGRHRRRTERG